MIRRNRIQEKISGSIFLLPVCAVAATVLWLFPLHDITVGSVLGWALCILTAYVLMEANSSLGLIRVRTRMVSCVWMLLAAAMPFMHLLGKPAVCALCLSVSLLLLMKCYQLHNPQFYVYHSFLFLSLGDVCSLAVIPMALLFYAYLAVFLRSLTWKGFWAGILGFATPYWCWFAYCLLTDNIDVFIGHFHDEVYPLASLATDGNPVQTFVTSLMSECAALPLVLKVSWAYLAVLSLVSVAHFLRNAYNDKIRVRMFMYIFVSQALALLLASPFFPSSLTTVLAMLIVCVSPLAAHWLTLGGGRFAGVMLAVVTLSLVSVSYVCLWMPS